MATPMYSPESHDCRTAVVDQAILLDQIPRQRDGGFLDGDTTQLPFDLQVTDWQDLSSRFSRGVGLIETSLVTVSDNHERFRAPSRFILRKVLPETQQFATSVDMMPPLGTRVNGYNTDIARQIAKQGAHVRIVGTNQTRGRSMLHDTQANLEILKADDERSSFGGSCCAPNQSIDLGYSMGAMKSFAKLVLAPMYGREVLLTKAIDPCVAQATGYGDIISREMAAYFLADAALIPKNMIRNARDTGVLKTMRRASHWSETVGFSPDFLGNTYDKWRTILTGEAGTFLPAAPIDSAVVMHSFNGSKMNDRDTFESQMFNFPNARFVHEDGRHLSAACATAIANLALDIALSLDLIESGASKYDIVNGSVRPLLGKR